MTRLFTILSLILAATANGQSLKTLSIDEQIADIEFIKTELEKFHPGVFTYQSEQEFEEGFATLKANLTENQTVFDFYNSLAPVINQVGCGHTTSYIPSSELKRTYKSRQYLPIEIKIIEDKMFVIKVLVDIDDLSPGFEIISIDGVSATEYIKTNLNRYLSDGRIMSRKYQNLEKQFSIDYSTFYYTSPSFDMEVDNNGDRKSVVVAGISYRDFIAKTSQPELEDLQFTVIDSISTAVITVRNSKSKKIFDKFLENSFSRIRTNKIDYLIIDVRYDSFNRDSDGADLFSYLTTAPFRYYDKLEVTKQYDVPKALRWIARYPIEQDSTGSYYWTIHPQLEMQAPKPKAFRGKVYVLTDGFTFSATSEFSSKIKSAKRGVTVGRETGGSYYGNNSGGMLRKVLPNSRIIVYIPPIHYYMAVKELGEYSAGVIPDIQITGQIDDYILGLDVIKEAAIEVIHQQR